MTYRHEDGTSESGYQQEQAVKKLLLVSGPSIAVTFLAHSRRHPQDDFHDRLVNIIVAAPEAMAGEHSFELTGGVDRLMGERFETRVFYVRGEGARRATAPPPPRQAPKRTARVR